MHAPHNIAAAADKHKEGSCYTTTVIPEAKMKGFEHAARLTCHQTAKRLNKYTYKNLACRCQGCDTGNEVPQGTCMQQQHMYVHLKKAPEPIAVCAGDHQS